MDQIIPPHILDGIPGLPPSIANMDDQWAALLVIATKLGLLLAADRIRQTMSLS